MGMNSDHVDQAWGAVRDRCCNPCDSSKDCVCFEAIQGAVEATERRQIARCMRSLAAKNKEILRLQGVAAMT